MRGFFRNFQLFIARGNVLDLAVAVVLGAAFGSITTSLVDDVIMPPIGYLIGGVDVQDLVLRLSSEVVIRYGAFLNTVINFLIVAFSMVVVVRLATAVQNFRRQEAESEAENCRSRSPCCEKSVSCSPKPPEKHPSRKIKRGKSTQKV